MVFSTDPLNLALLAVVAGGSFWLGWWGRYERLKAQRKAARREGQELALIRDAADDDDLEALDRSFGLNSLARKRRMDPAELAALRCAETRERHRRAAEVLAELDGLRAAVRATAGEA